MEQELRQLLDAGDMETVVRYGPFVESEQIWALSRNILLYGPRRPFTAQVFFKKATLVDEQINPAVQSQIADSGAISQLFFLIRDRSDP